ncbi:MAG: hypothetical protein F6K23_10550 [Okeania sp. SIO2C9]|uniref:hypothetical protein n=1 Tax=unclassified Okeania TaxID=2634635 RepID=UPI0013C1424C|nr:MULTISPECIES: hypothetical protein [unclassified Okeania]NEO53457.1 hypothetical protein [Okeania sp. SIO3B5]NEQ73467.1 hypothetical protein [Okeania sp. SIO2C9]
MSTLLLSWRKFFPEDIILSLPVEQSGTKQSQSRVIITVGWVKRQRNPTIYLSLLGFIPATRRLSEVIYPR